MGRIDRRLFAVACLFVLSSGPIVLAAATARAPGTARPPGDAAPAPSGGVDQGRRLFTGQLRFANGGPPCGACHQSAALGFPNGGLVGPDLSGIAATLGPDGLDVTLRTLFFPTMMPLYAQRPLTADEQRALKGFFAQTGTAGVGPGVTVVLGAIALAGLAVLLASMALVWRHRLRGVRAPLVRQALSRGVRP